MSKYPKIRQVHKKPKNTAAKCECGQLAKFKTEVEFNYMRGDDEFFWVCDTHKRDLEFILK